MRNYMLNFIIFFALTTLSFAGKRNDETYRALKPAKLNEYAHYRFTSDKKQVYSDDTIIVTVKPDKLTGTVNPNIMGFNIVYCYESDAFWKSGNGKVPAMLSSINAKQLRYPGGTVVTKYHWEKPTGQGWKDIWDPQFDTSKNTSPSSFMDIDEYLELTKKQNLEPLVGVNMGSGMKYNRVADGVAEAIRLMKHCISKGVKVKYYYLDNEPYQHDANFTFTPEQYADMINTYVPAMKKVDPNIKIIVNTHPRTDNYIKPLLEKAGKNIDLVDVHMYWKFKNATFDNWKNESQMTHQNRGTYAEQRQIWENLFADAGYPNIKLVVLEWNIGPPGENIPPTQSEAALMVSEQFAQFIKSGLFMSCFWPVSWPDKTDWTSRALFQAKEGYKPNQMYNMFSMYKDVLGQQKVESASSNQRFVNLAVKSNDGKTLWVYIINKFQDADSSPVNLSLEDFKASSFSVDGFDSQNIEKQILGKQVNISNSGNSDYRLSIPKNAFVKITFKK